MQEHLIPQDITNYRFHLIGELDLIQFSEILFGIIGGFIIFQTNWPAFIKWPLIVIVVSVGLLAAFFPIGDRPLSHWLKIYFAGLFAPTKFYWRKQTVIPAFFDFQLSNKHQEFLDQVSTFNAAPVKKRRALVYFDTLESNKAREVDELELFSPSKISQISQSLTQETSVAPQPPATPQVVHQKVSIKKNLKTEQTERVRQIITPSQKTLEQYLSNARIFKPKEVTTAISGVESSLRPNLSWPSKDRVTSATPTTTLTPTTQTPPPPSSPAPATPPAPQPPTVNSTPVVTDTHSQTTTSQLLHTAPTSPQSPTTVTNTAPKQQSTITTPVVAPAATPAVISAPTPATADPNRRVTLPSALNQNTPQNSSSSLAAKVNSALNRGEANVNIGGVAMPVLKSRPVANANSSTVQTSELPKNAPLFATTTHTSAYKATQTQGPSASILPGNN